ncbi:MAG: GspE/PulE family protein [Candidatus Jacksonbacteria bacterium]
MPNTNQDIGAVLLQENKITLKQYQELQKKALQSNVSLVEAISESGIVEKEDFIRAQAKALGLEFVDLVGQEIDLQILEIIPESLAINYKMVAIGIAEEDNLLNVAMLDPRDVKAREALTYIGRERKLKIKYFLTDEESLQFALKQYANLKKEVGEALKSAQQRFKQKAQGETEVGKKKIKDDIQEVLKHAPVAKMVLVILRHAVEGKASDIHIEPMQDISRVRYRIDGSLATSITLPLYIHDALVARVKVMANLKIDETRVPQDGRIRLELPNRDVEFRVSSLPLQDHEKVVMRVLDTGGSAPTLADLGYKANNFEIIKRNLSKPNGMILITGPTGSGKSMTLFSALNIVNSEDVNISTLEDPVEYRLQGINQSQMHPEVGFSFATGLRALLRQDPDIIMVGEIRDQETAELAVHAAMTGHLVFSTLHTNSALGAIPRLLDMHLEPFLLSSTLNVAIAQRLVKTICSECKEEKEIDEHLRLEILNEIKLIPRDVIDKYGSVSLDKPVFYYGRGCAKCAQSGFKGRTSISEVIENTKEIKKAINTGMKQEDVEAALKAQNFITMKQDGLIKTLLGLTAPEQVLAVTKGDL